MKRQITVALLPLGLVIFCLTFGHVTTAAPGDLDPTFGRSGKLTDGIQYASERAQAVAIQADGKIVAAGTSYNYIDTSSSFGIVRYNLDGSPDISFGIGGKVVTAIGTDDQVNSVAVQADGKIVAAGRSGNYP